jgi:hypothetical protein
MRARQLAFVVALITLAGCDDQDGCGGATCPFGDLAFAAIEGRVTRADGSPHVADFREGVWVSVGPGQYGLGVPTDGGGRYRIVLDLPFDPGGESVPVSISAGVPSFGAQLVTIPFSRARSARPTTTVDIHEQP